MRRRAWRSGNNAPGIRYRSLPALAKLLVASVAGALAMSLLAYAGSGRLGNFGHVGVDQGALMIGVFFWFALVGSITVVMAGGIRRPPRRRKPAPEPEPVEEPDEPADEAPGEAGEPSEAAETPDGRNPGAGRARSREVVRPYVAA